MPYVKKHIRGYQGRLREACIKLFQNQQWEFPPELKPPTIEAPPKEFTLWDAIQVYFNDASLRLFQSLPGIMKR